MALNPEEKRDRKIARELELTIEQAHAGSTYWERERERSAIRRELDPDYHREADRKSYAKYREERLAAKKRARVADPEKFKARERAYDAAHREKRRLAQLARNTAYYQRNREAINVKRRALQVANVRNVSEASDV